MGDLPNEILSYLLNSRYCEVDRFSNIAFELFGHVSPGWDRVQAICNWVHTKIAFNYQQARPTKTALDAISANAQSTLAAQSGVNLNTEAANLMQYQQAFQASGKVIQVANTLFQQLLQI